MIQSGNKKRYRYFHPAMILWCVSLSCTVFAQEQVPGKLGLGLLHIACDFEMTPVNLYKDSSCTHLFLVLTPEQTTCPECMACAEPEKHYHGPVHPFTCGNGMGMNFICLRSAAHYNEIVTDNSGNCAFVQKDAGRFYDWNSYYSWQGKTGEYFVFERQWDNTILYDKPYPLSALPHADASMQLGVHFKDLSNLRFYPDSVQGYWMKLKAVRDKITVGYCWVIWRNKEELLLGFHFRTD